MATFLQIQDEVLDYVNRPAAEMRTQVKREINKALVQIQREHKFKYAERLCRITYPANELTVELLPACDGRVRDYISIQTAIGNEDFGRPVHFLSYNEVIQARFRNQRTKSIGIPEVLEDGTLQVSRQNHPDFVSRIHQFYAFRLKNQIGLYPTPASNINVLVNFHTWLPPLDGDDNTDFLTDYCEDLVVYQSVLNMLAYMKNDNRLGFFDKLVEKAWSSAKNWDGEVDSCAQYSEEI